MSNSPPRTWFPSDPRSALWFLFLTEWLKFAIPWESSSNSATISGNWMRRSNVFRARAISCTPVSPMNWALSRRRFRVSATCQAARLSCSWAGTGGPLTGWWTWPIALALSCLFSIRREPRWTPQTTFRDRSRLFSWQSIREGPGCWPHRQRTSPQISIS